MTDTVDRIGPGRGLPLSADERRRAAGRLLEARRPDWSDRRLAAACGLSRATVAELRARSATGSAGQSSREGLDGRRRPVDPAAARTRAAQLLAEDPQLPLGEVADPRRHLRVDRT